MPAGEVVTSFASDFWRMGNVFDVTARLAGAVVSFVVVSIILLQRVGAARRHHARGRPAAARLAVPRHASPPAPPAGPAARDRACSPRSAPTRWPACACCAGIGGEDAFLARYAAQSDRVRHAGVRLSGVQATLDAAQVLLPGIFVVVVTGIGAHLAVAGEISPGQLVAFYGYTAFLTMPLRTATEFVDKLVRARVAARRVTRILGVEPDHSDDSTVRPRVTSGSMPGPPCAPRATAWSMPGRPGAPSVRSWSMPRRARAPTVTERSVQGRSPATGSTGSSGPGRSSTRCPASSSSRVGSPPS